jgi:uncharacterized protein
MRVIAQDVFTQESRPRLIGGRHRVSGRIVFPCPPGNDYDLYPLGREGVLWSYTIQRFRPKSPPYAGPEDFAPWAVGYVELPGETIVEARLSNIAFEDIHIGMALELVLVALDPAAADPVMTHAFQPKEHAA